MVPGRAVEVPRSTRTVLIVPPFAGINRPSLAAHLLQAIARLYGFELRVVYANLRLAALIGEDLHQKMCYTSASTLIGERFFSRTAYGGPPLGRNFDHSKATAAGYDYVSLLQAEQATDVWLDEFAESVVNDGHVIGCSTTFEQTAGSIAILSRIKRVNPGIITIIGGANCEGPMAEGVCELGHHAVDYVFSSESEATFPQFLIDLEKNKRPNGQIIRGAPCLNLDDLPLPIFDEYFDQLTNILPKSIQAELPNVWLPYESSRGCWWGQKQHCTFCGINGEGMVFREKSPHRVVNDLATIADRYNAKNICMVDNIMPFHYFDTVLPAIADRLPGRFHIFYEQKANLTPTKVSALKAAGVNLIQPGIEALSTDLLRLMKKGVTAKQNINLLRYARSVQMSVNWNLLWGFPGDHVSSYIKTLELLPFLRHLHPPTGLCALSIERFSPYYFDPDTYAVKTIRPVSSYEDVIPEGINASAIAYHFTGSYQSGSKDNMELIHRLYRAVIDWRKAWGCQDEVTSATASDGVLSAQCGAPFLGISPMGEDSFLLIDTRGLAGSEPIQFLNQSQAEVVLKAHPEGCDCELTWAIRSKLLAPVEDEWIPLVTADSIIMEKYSVQSLCKQPRRTLNVLMPSARNTVACS